MRWIGRPLVVTTMIVGLMCLIAACGGPSGTTAVPAPPPTAADFNALEQPEEVPVIARKHLGEDVHVRHIVLYDNGFSMEVRDPRKPENLDTYRYDGQGWTSAPVSVSMSDIQDLPATTFGLGAVNWRAVPSLIQQAYDGLDLEGEEVTAVSYDRIKGHAPRVYIGVTGLRGNGRLLGNADGTGVEVTRN